MEKITYVQRYFVYDEDEEDENSTASRFSGSDRDITVPKRTCDSSSDQAGLFCHNIGNSECYVGTAAGSSRNQNVGFSHFSETEPTEDEIDRQGPPLLEQNLRKIIRNFKRCQDSLKLFLNVYPKWSGRRRRCISELIEIAEALDKTRFDSNMAKLVGAAVAAAGGIAGVVAVALSAAVTMGLSVPLGIGAAVVSIAGGSTSVGAAVAELVHLRIKVKEVQDLLKEDEKEFEVMCQWFRHSVAYVDSVSELAEFDPTGQIVRDAKKLYNILWPKDEDKTPSGNTVLSSITDAGLKALRKAGLSPDLSRILISTATNPRSGEVFREMLRLHSENPPLYEGATMTVKLFLLAKGYDIGTDCILPLFRGTSVGTVAAGVSIGRLVSQGIFVGLALAIDVLSLILTSIDVHNGSKSPSSKKIQESNKGMNRELDMVKKMYYELMKRQAK